MPLNLISKERALAVIGEERLRLLAECHAVGWSDWATIRGTQPGSSLTKTARARIIYDGAVRHANEVFPSAMCGRKHGLLVLDFGLVLTRFKLLQADLTPRGIPTGQAVMFESQGHVAEQTTIWPHQPMLITGYILDRLGTEIVRQVLILRHDGNVVWEHDLRGDAEQQPGPTVTTMPTPPKPPAPADVHSGRPDVEVEKEAE